MLNHAIASPALPRNEMVPELLVTYLFVGTPTRRTLSSGRTRLAVHEEQASSTHYHEKASSKKSISVYSQRSRMARRTSSLRAPVPHTLMAMAPI